MGNSLLVSSLGREVEVFSLYIKAEICLEISDPYAPLANSVTISTVSVLCQWEDKVVYERTGTHLHMLTLRKLSC